MLATGRRGCTVILGRNHRDRGSLPHHDEVAVDSQTMGSGHRLYQDPAEYGRRFLERRDAATAHVKAVYAHWREG